MSYVEQHMVDALRNHTLTEITPKGSSVRAFSMREGGSRIMSVLLLFTPEGIILAGDLRLTTSGVVIAYHQDLNWFLGALHEQYLCSKFLQKEWQPSVAERDLLCLMSESDDLTPERKEALTRVFEDIDTMTQHDFRAALQGHLDEEVAAGLGAGDYSHADAGWLVIIQRTFATLYPTLPCV